MMAHNLKPTERFEGRAERIMPGGFNAVGLVARVYSEDISGEFIYLSPRHLYQPSRGIDVYPSVAQLEQLLAGEQVKFAMDQWA